MKRTLIALMAVTFAAASAHAASVVVGLSTGDFEVTQGEVITLEIRVTVDGTDGTDTSLFGSLNYPTSGIGPVAPGTQTPLTGSWAAGPLSCNTTRCLVFSQTAGLNGPQPGNATNFLIGSQNYTVLGSTPLGTVLTWRWQTSPLTQQVDFYNFNNAVAPVPALSVTVIPEPTTAALLGLGLLGLAVAGRRRA
jgi:hypothetical protein